MKWFSRKSLGFGSAGITRQRECGAILIMPSSLTGLQLGVGSAETAVSLVRFVCRYYLAINRKLENNSGEPFGRARSSQFSREIDMEGEITAATGGPMSYTVAAACTVTNAIAEFGTTPGILLLDEVTVTQQRGEFKTGAWKLSSDPNLTSV